MELEVQEDDLARDVEVSVFIHLNRATTGAYDRTTTYLIDKHGIVRQIFPMTINARPSWELVLGEVERLLAP